MAQVLNMFDDVEAPEELDEETPSSPEGAPRDDFDKNGNNPPTTRALEVRNELVPGTPASAPVVQLVAAFGDQGQVRVAKAVDGKRVEQWRAPTPDEWTALQQRGRIVKGGLAAAPAAPAPAPVAPETPSIMPKLLVGGALLAAAGAAFYFWRQHKEMEENVEEMD